MSKRSPSTASPSSHGKKGIKKKSKGSVRSAPTASSGVKSSSGSKSTFTSIELNKTKSSDAIRSSSMHQQVCPFVPSKPANELAKVKTTQGAIQAENRTSIPDFGHNMWKQEHVREYVNVHKAAMNTTQMLESTINDVQHVLCKEVRLKDCTARYRTNMMNQSLAIQRFLLCGGQVPQIYRNEGGPVKCPYFVALYNIFSTEESIYIFMINCSHGSLHDRAKDRKNTPNQVREWTKQLVSAVHVIHEFGVAHRAIKLQHVMLRDDSQVQVISWNKAVSFWDETEPGHQYLLLQHRERRSRKNRHLPPECFSSTSGYDPSKVDLWSVGCIAVALTTNRYPFNPNCKYSFAAQWTAFVARHHLHDYLRDACDQLFMFDPLKRLSSEKFLAQCKYFDQKLNMDKLVESRTTRPKSTPQQKKTTTKTRSNVSKGNMVGRTKSQGSNSNERILLTKLPSSSSTSQTRTKSSADKVSKDSKVSRSNSKCSKVTTRNAAAPSGSKDFKVATKTSRGSKTKVVSKESQKPSSVESRNVPRSKSLDSKSSSGKSQYKTALSSNSNDGKSTVSKQTNSPESRKSASRTSSKDHLRDSKNCFKSFTVDPGLEVGASGNEGGAVDEKLPPEEFKHESMASVRSAPEESEEKAQIIRMDITSLRLRNK